ncbi:MAG: hypothetical protein RSC11_06055 [Mucinivorans sp.]
MGIKRKIITGFISIGSLLLLSGIISSGELLRLNRTTSDLLKRSRGNIELSKTMLDAVQEENTALLMSLTDTTAARDSILALHVNNFQSALNENFSHFRLYNLPTDDLDKISQAAQDYNQVITTISGSMNVALFSEVYKTTYHKLTTAIKDFMISTQNNIIDFATQIESNAYRASMVGIIALASGFLLIVMFYFMLNNFFIKPVLDIRRALANYLERSIPFEVPVATDDEIRDISRLTSQLIERSKR